jgi:hypothetical protein
MVSWPTRSKMRELEMVRGNLMRLSQALKERTAQGEIEDTRELLDSINAWTAHEEWVRKLVAVTVTIGLQYPGHGNTPLSCNADTGPSEVREAGHFRTLAENTTEPTRTNGR